MLSGDERCDLFRSAARSCQMKRVDQHLHVGPPGQLYQAHGGLEIGHQRESA